MRRAAPLLVVLLLLLLHTPHGKGQQALIKSLTPVGVAAYFAIAPNFPLAEYMRMMAVFDRPLTSFVADVDYVYARDNLQMFGPRPATGGARPVNTAQIAAIVSYLRDFTTACNRSSAPSVQLFLVNGPAQRAHSASMYSTFNLSIPDFSRAIVDPTYVRALVAALQPLVATTQLHVRLTPVLEDNMDLDTAEAMERLVRDSGMWPWDTGRNPCGCAVGSDLARLPALYWERHLGGPQDVDAMYAQHQPGDAWSNDGWLGDIPSSNISWLAELSQRKPMWHAYWYGCIQGYCSPLLPSGRRNLSFACDPTTLTSAMLAGIARVVPQQLMKRSAS